ncbi:beta/gamma crystallin-related protein [Photobacterium japonica]|uniref:beta/gamma crystallin-related protein n=1 Tax=Photobacterium japonica TaxID=2910235 RepID=UPI003D0E59F0
MNKWILLIAILSFTTVAHANTKHYPSKPYPSTQGKVYVCTLQPFQEVFADVGISEDMARYKVKRRCEQSQGEDSIFCRAREAKCITSTLLFDDEPNEPNHVVIYSRPHQRGKTVVITHDEPDLADFHFNDAMSSYFIPAHWTVRFYEGKNYTGSFYTRSGGKANAAEFDNTVSSIRVLSR